MQVRTNLVQNPKFQNDGNFWSADSEFTINTGSGGALSGGYVRQQSPSGGFANFTTVNDDVNGYAVASNTDYRLSFYVRLDSQSGNLPQLQVNADHAYGTTINSMEIPNTGGVYQRVTIDFNSGTAALIFLRIYNNNGNIDARYSNFMLETLDKAGAYFDGDDTDGGGITYDWTGSANASTSTRTQSFDTNTKTFTVDGIIFARNTITFTVDGIIVNSGTLEDINLEETMAHSPSGDILNNAAYVSGSPGYLRLTQAVNGQNGELDYSHGVSQKFIMESDFYALGDADSNFMYWGADAVPDNEDDANGGYSVALDEYEGDGDAGTVELTFDTTKLVKTVYPRDLGDGTIRTLKAVVDSNHILVYVNNVLVIDYTDTVRALAGNHLGVGARTGGLNSEHRCYRFKVQTFTGDFHPTPLINRLSALTYRSVDVMKWTKDLINGQPSASRIRAVVKVLKDHYNLTHIAIAVPLDKNDDYLAVGTVPGPSSVELFTKLWCDAIHDAGLNVLYRGDFNAWERSGASGNWNFILEVGINRLAQGTAASAATDGQTTALGKIDDFIRGHPEYFEDGDIFAPCPERTENNTEVENIQSITRSGTTATVTYASNHNVGDQQPVRISGADQAEYNGSFIATKVSDTVFTIQVTGTPASPATGTLQSQFGVSPYTDENSIFSYSPGVTDNYAAFFNDLITVANNAFSAIGKNVHTGFSSNNYSEVNSGWIPNSVFDTAGLTAVDHYGVTHTPFEMYSDMVGIFLSKGHPIVWQEWSDYWDGALDEQTRLDYLTNFYNMMVDLYDEGVIELFNYWGGWVGGLGEGVLLDVGTEENPEYDINSFGLLLASYFAAEAVPPPTGAFGTPFGYYLNGVKIKTPQKFKREYIFQKTDYTTLNGKTVRDTSHIKEKFTLHFENLTKAEVDAIDTICALGTPVALTINGHDVVNIQTTVFPYIGSILYDIVGSTYLASLDLELIEEE